MSNWLSSFSLPNPFESDSDVSDAGDGDAADHNPTITSPSTGVKQDLSAISQSFSHHLRGVAAFLAPPPQPSSSGADSHVPGEDATGLVASSGDPKEAINGIKKDLVEIGGSFKALFSTSSSGISKFASNLLQHQGDGVGLDDVDNDDDDQEEEEEAEIPGSTDDVVEFVRKVSLRPELWTDFPLSLPIGFDMSDVQKQHAAVMEELVPDLLILRQSCSDMSDGQFWMIYFILLLPRLNETDMELLSSSQIVEVRETLMKKLQDKKKALVEESSGISETSNAPVANEHINVAQGNVSSSKDISPEKASSTSEREVESQKSGDPAKNGEDVDDVSFSDLEDEDNDLSDRVSGFKPTQSGRASSSSDSNDWVRLNENSGAQSGQNKSGLPTRFGKDSEGEESSDWLTVDGSDTDTH